MGFFDTFREFVDLIKEAGEDFKPLLNDGAELFTNGLYEYIVNKNEYFQTSSEIKQETYDKEKEISEKFINKFNTIKNKYNNVTAKYNRIEGLKTNLINIINKILQKEQNSETNHSKSPLKTNLDNIIKQFDVIENNFNIYETPGYERKKTNIWFIDKEIRIKEAKEYQNNVEIFETKAKYYIEKLNMIRALLKEIDYFLNNEMEDIKYLLNNIGVTNIWSYSDALKLEESLLGNANKNNFYNILDLLLKKVSN